MFDFYSYITQKSSSNSSLCFGFNSHSKMEITFIDSAHASSWNKIISSILEIHNVLTYNSCNQHKIDGEKRNAYFKEYLFTKEKNTSIFKHILTTYHK